MYISYSGYKHYTSCPFAYWNDYVNHTPSDAVDDRLGSVFGSAVGLVFEWFYAKKLWTEPDIMASLMAHAETAVDQVIKQETTGKRGRPGGVLLWKGDGPNQNPKGMYANRAELLADVRDAVARGLRIIKHYRFLGKPANAEVVLDATINGHKIGGRADFIIKRVPPQNDLLLLDGKGSKHRAKYVDPKQLLWYAMLYQFHNKVLPDRLGFVFWRYEPPETVDWVEFHPDDLVALKEEVLSNVNKIVKLEAKGITDPNTARKVWFPKADEGNCRFCPHASTNTCPAGYEVAQAIARKAARYNRG